MARNMHQVLGLTLDVPTDFIVCWTPDGKASGGTGQALRVAKDFSIPIYNLKNADDLECLKEDLLKQMYYDYGGYEEYTEHIIIPVKGKLFMWSNIDTIPSGKYVLEYLLSDGIYIEKHLTPNLVLIKNKDKDVLTLEFIRRFKR